MTLLAVTRFQGMYPKTAPHLLEEGMATNALDCDFAHGDLRGVPDIAAAPRGVFSGVVRSLYAPNSEVLYAWSTGNVQCTTVPNPNRVASKVYFLTGGAFKYTPVPATPSAIFDTVGAAVGVSPPTAAPTTIFVAPSVLPRGATVIKAEFWYEKDGKKYQISTLDPASTQRLAAEYTFTAPGKITGTPMEAQMVVRLYGLDAKSSTVFSAISTNSVYSKKSSEIPGGMWVSLIEVSTTSFKVLMEYGELGETSFVYTRVVNGEESAPSPELRVSYSSYQTQYGCRITITGPVVARVYMTAVSSTGNAEYQFLRDIQITMSGSVTVNVLIPTDTPPILGEVLQTLTWQPPPSGCTSFADMGNGIYALAKGNTIYFSEPYVPYAWNPLNCVTLAYPVQAMRPHYGSLAVLTTANPFLISGNHPSGMSALQLPIVQGLLNPNCVVEAGGMLVYASNDGLVTLQGNQASTELGQQFWTREDWRALWANSTEMHLAAYDNYIVGFKTSGSTNFMLRVDEGRWSLTNFSHWGTASAVSSSEDNLYFAQNNRVYFFAQGTRRTFTWRSRPFILKKPENFGVLQVVIPKGTVAVTVYADGVARQTITGITQNGNGHNVPYQTYRLKSGFLARSWAFQITGTGIVQEFYVALTGTELGNR